MHGEHVKQSVQQHNLTNQSPLAPALGDLRLHEHSLEHFSHTESHISKSKRVQTPKERASNRSLAAGKISENAWCSQLEL